MDKWPKLMKIYENIYKSETWKIHEKEEREKKKKIFFQTSVLEEYRIWKLNKLIFGGYGTMSKKL